MNGAKIQLEHIQFPVARLKVTNYKENETQTAVKFSLSLADNFDRDISSRHFNIAMKLTVKSTDGIRLAVEVQAIFKTDVDITEEFMAGNFPKINAPAIVYPYVRSFVSNLTLNGGYKPVILPAVNFVQLIQEQQNNKVE